MLFRQQHGEILRILADVRKLAAAAPEQDVCLELSRLAGVVKLHLTLEDQNMYPRMLAHHETTVRETARKFQETMGQLARVYMAFHEKWMKSGAIENGRAAFVRDFATIDDALSDRIRLENVGLYDVIDRANLVVA